MIVPSRRATRLVFTLGLSFAACAAERTSATWRLLVFSETAGFRHDSIDEGQALLAEAGVGHGFAPLASEDSSIFSAAGLAPFHGVVFLNTTGDILTASEQDALDCFVRSGGGWVGVHSAADTEHGWAAYGDLLGGDAWIANHPAIQTATIDRESATHPSTAHFPASFEFTDEWYNFAANPRPEVMVLLTIDESSYDPGPGGMGTDHPLAWANAYGAGRSWYTNLGHSESTYGDEGFVSHLVGGALWATRCDSGCESDLVFRDGFESASKCRWSGN